MLITSPMKTLEAINEYLEAQKEPMRDYLGISSLGHKCDRYIFLLFRWAREEKLDGRMIRLLDRGKREEEVIVALLRSVGVEVTEVGSDQREITLSEWVKGHSDGIIKTGLKESSKPHILEIKTSNDKAFKLLKEKGVKVAKPMHYAQMQLYMLGTGIDRAFYTCVNKNDDEIYTERIYFDKEYAESLAQKGKTLALENTLPPALSNLPTWFECKGCRFWGVCHNHEKADKNCRTCEHARFMEGGYLYCTENNTPIATRCQTVPCKGYKMHFDLENLCLN